MSRSRLDIALDGQGPALPEAGRVLVLNAPPPQELAALPAARTDALSDDAPTHGALAAAGYGAESPGQGRHAAALVAITRSKVQTLGLIGRAVGAVAPGGPVMVDGQKTDGIDSVLKAVRALVPLDGTLSKGHGKLFWFARPDHPPATFAAWERQARPRRGAHGFVTAPGMFSADGPDPASELLAGFFDARLTGRIADLGAGWGWLALQALQRGRPERVDLFESDRPSLEAARLNLQEHAARASFHWADVTALPARPEYDAVICNPPFHTGRAADPALGEAFIAAAHRILKPGGTLWLVANRHLPYERALDARFQTLQTLAETGRFKAILTSRPRPARPARRAARSAAPRPTRTRR